MNPFVLWWMEKRNERKSGENGNENVKDQRCVLREMFSFWLCKNSWHQRPPLVTTKCHKGCRTDQQWICPSQSHCFKDLVIFRYSRQKTKKVSFSLFCVGGIWNFPQTSWNSKASHSYFMCCDCFRLGIECQKTSVIFRRDLSLWPSIFMIHVT